ncbi:2TM domain-containing protein [Formosa sp. Hel1_31_208]|uniref:2TM domain-containing protein n=1 Tax=Formosa sp. Hel1_31_208 TaxID=1798225 RepID=UPI00087B008E|nr:2TM domain-containing protein [Formosa sp. Hel1_31_208]SDS67459.1 2TM domain-containing protein [Formosa sp. Hel1_31_208]
MKLNKDEEKRFLKAKHKVQRIKIFYLHVVLYVIVVALISYNFYILEEGPYTDNITGINVSTLVLWTVFICIHGWTVFKGRLLFKKSWEDKKIEKILKEKENVETTFWE